MGKLSELIKEYKMKTAKECYAIEVINGETPGILDDKIGGSPYWPVDMKWSDNDCLPQMALLLQVNLRNIELDGFPKQGILEIFVDENGDWDSDAKIFILDEGLDYIEDLPKYNMDDFFTSEPLKIKLTKVKEFMPINLDCSENIICELLEKYFDKGYERLLDCEEEIEDDEDEIAFDNLLEVDSEEVVDGRTFANIGGYPDYTQSNRDLYDVENDMCLFKLDSMLSDSINIGDLGILTIVMPKEQFENRDFDDVSIYCDCQ